MGGYCIARDSTPGSPATILLARTQDKCEPNFTSFWQFSGMARLLRFPERGQQCLRGSSQKLQGCFNESRNGVDDGGGSVGCGVRKCRGQSRLSRTRSSWTWPSRAPSLWTLGTANWSSRCAACPCASAGDGGASVSLPGSGLCLSGLPPCARLRARTCRGWLSDAQLFVVSRPLIVLCRIAVCCGLNRSALRRDSLTGTIRRHSGFSPDDTRIFAG
jgi:hypothetical protein